MLTRFGVFLLNNGRGLLISLLFMTVIPLQLRAGQPSPFATTASQIAEALEATISQTRDQLAKNEIGNAHQSLSLLKMQIDKNGKSLDRQQKKEFTARMNSLAGQLRQKTDSLVKVNLSILEKEGHTAGYAFRQHLSMQLGLTEIELSAVDEAIVESGLYGDDTGAIGTRQNTQEASAPVKRGFFSLPEAQTLQPEEEPAAKPASKPVKEHAEKPKKETAPAADKPVRKGFFSLPEAKKPQPPAEPVAVPESKPAIEPVQEPPYEPVTKPTYEPENKPLTEPPPSPIAAPVVAPIAAPVVAENRPSPEDERNQATASAMHEKIRGLISQGGLDDASTLFQIYQANMQRYLDKKEYDALKNDLEQAVTKKEADRSVAVKQSKNIERLLDEDKVPDAFAELKKSRDLLQQQLSKEDMRGLEKRVGQAYVGFLERQGKAHGTMRHIRDLIGNNRSEEAYLAFEQSKTELARCLPPETYAGLSRDIAAVNRELKDKKSFYEACVKNIQSLVKAGRGPEALSKFNENREMIAHYADRSGFDNLQDLVVKSNQSFLDRQRKALACAGSIDSLVNLKEIVSAWNLFEESKTILKRDLADDKKFFELRDRVKSDHDKYLEEARQCSRTANKAGYLIKLSEGRKAYALVTEQSWLLKKHLSPGAFNNLFSAATAASALYDKKCQDTRDAINSINTLLDRKETDRAWALYKKTESDLAFYMNDDPAAQDLGKRVNAAWAYLQERKRFVAAQMRDIQKLIRDRRGDLALQKYQSNQGELTLYLEPRINTSLYSETVKAESDFRNTTARMVQQATLVRNLLDEKQVENAYTAFDTAEVDLRFYLAPVEFNQLKTSVEQANEAMMEKKKEALHISRTVNGYIENGRGDSAFVLLKQNEAMLEKHLSAPIYKKLEERADHAKNEYERNSKSAYALSRKLEALTHKNQEEAAYNEFSDKSDFLKLYLNNQAFEQLKETVLSNFNAFATERKKARALVSTLNRMIKDHHGVEAKSEFENSEKFFGRYLPASEYRDISAKVTSAYNSSVDGRQEAKSIVIAIHRLLEDGHVADAYTMFREAHSSLDLYIPAREYAALQTEVTYANSEQERKVDQIKEYAKVLRQQVGKDEYYDAYRGFQVCKTDLSEFLDAQTYADLEQLVVGSYKKAKEKAKKKFKKSHES